LPIADPRWKLDRELALSANSSQSPSRNGCLEAANRRVRYADADVYRAGIAMTLDDSITQFRLASRELFNTGWLLLERFSQVESVLFDHLVAAESSWRLGSYGRHQPNILVILRGLDFAPIMINREVDAGYWETIRLSRLQRAHNCPLSNF
jgi:hypothetical protein